MIDGLQAQLGDARHQAGVLQGRLDAFEAANVTLQQQLAAARGDDARPARAKAAPARPTAAPALTRALRSAATPGRSRRASATPASPATADKPVVRRKRG
ncbi:hypothetical protein OKW42_004436 [Paraburkholderia sp. WC7.3d]